MNLHNFKKIAIVTTLLASTPALAGNIQFDPDGAAGTFHSPKLLSQLALTPTATSNVIVQNLGADGILGDFDTFTESLSYKVPSALFLDGSSAIYGDTSDTTFGSATSDVTVGYFQVDLNIIGHIENFVGGTVSDSSAASRGAFLSSTFDVIFDWAPAAAILTWFDGDGSSKAVGVWDVLSGGAGGVDVGSTATQNFELNLAFNAATPDGYWSDSYDMPISNFIAINQAFGVADADANLQGIAPDPLGGTGGVNGTINIAASQNPTAIRFQVPEPTSIALLGLGLLGFAGVRRRKS